MSPLPHPDGRPLQARPEPAVGQAQLYWHILMRDQPQVCAVAALARQRLDSIPGCTSPPSDGCTSVSSWLGLDSDIPRGAVDGLVAETRQRLQSRSVCRRDPRQGAVPPRGHYLGRRPGPRPRPGSSRDSRGGPQPLPESQAAARTAAGSRTSRSPTAPRTRPQPHYRRARPRTAELPGQPSSPSASSPSADPNAPGPGNHSLTCLCNRAGHSLLKPRLPHAAKEAASPNLEPASARQGSAPRDLWRQVCSQAA